MSNDQKKDLNLKSDFSMDNLGNKILRRRSIHDLERIYFKHDEVYRGLLKHPEMLIDFLKTIQFPHIPIEKITVEDVIAKDTSILGKNHGQERSDLLFRVRIKDEKDHIFRESYIFICLEHQSHNDPRMPIRVKSYIYGHLASIMSDETYLASGRGLPPFWPIVIFTNCESNWTAPLDVRSCMDQETLERFPMLNKFYESTPAYDLVHIKKMDESTLLSMDTIFSLIVLCEKADTPRKRAKAEEDLSSRIYQMEQINPGLARFLEEWYYYYRAKQFAVKKSKRGEEINIVEAETLTAVELRQFTTKSVKGAYEKYAEEAQLKGRQEGIEEGRQRGIEEGRQEGIEEGRKETTERLRQILKNMLNKQYANEGLVFWQNHLADKNTDPKLLDRLIDLVVDKVSLDDLIAYL